MEKKLIKLKSEYLQLFGQVSKLFNYSNQVQSEIYHQGKKDAYEEIIFMLNQLSESKGNNISIQWLTSLIKEKIEREKVNIPSLKESTNEDKVNINNDLRFEFRKRKLENDMNLDTNENLSNILQESTCENYRSAQGKKRKLR